MRAILFAALVRAWCLAGIPLTICNDGAWYIHWARMLRASEPIDWPPARTPGYSLFLAGIFSASGEGPVGILLAQHTLGCLIVGLIAAAACRFAGPRWGLAIGIMAALDPALLAMECYVMTEALATALLVACAAMVLLSRRRLWASAGFGMALGAICLVRPAFQVLAPFLVLAWLLERPRAAPTPGRPRWGALLAAVAAGGLLVTGPWLVRNWRAGVIGMSASNSAVLWIGVCEAGLLADDFPLPDEVRARYEQSVRPAPDIDENVIQMVSWLDAWRSDQNRTLLKDWAVHSIRSDPGRYATTVAGAVGWQLQVFPRTWFGRPGRYDEMKWLLGRLGEDAWMSSPRQVFPNFQLSGTMQRPERFMMPAGRGPFTRYFRWWANRSWVGLPRVALFGCAIAATVLLARRRRWGGALLLLGTLAYTGMHAAFLLVPSRYSLPCWIVWWIGLAVVAGAAGEWVVARRRAREKVSTAGTG